MGKRFTECRYYSKKDGKGNQSVRPINFLEEYDAEKYFELLILMKEDLECSHELSRFKPHRHQKILGKPQKTIRG